MQATGAAQACPLQQWRRRLLRDIAEGKALGDTTTLADPAVIERLKGQYADSE